MKNKYFIAAESGEVLEITIYGDIKSWEYQESDVSSYTLSKMIQESRAKVINVNINSYGGEVAEGLAIYNALKNHSATVRTRCDGFACSAASVVFMAGDVRLMNEASLLMIHNAWTVTSGNAAQLRKEADDLETISKTVAKVYLSCAAVTEEELQSMLDSETWLTPEEAEEKGFATGVIKAADADRQQYSARETIYRQLVDGISKRESAGKPAVGDSAKIPESGFLKLFDTFNKKTKEARKE